jgi:hypothetical protein
MKKTIIILLITSITFSLNAQRYAYSKIDTIIYSLTQKIIEDLLMDSITISQERPPYSDTTSFEFFELSVKFFELFQRDFLMQMQGRPDSLLKKQKRMTAPEKQFYYNIFLKNLSNNKYFPFEICDYFDYKFLIIKTKNDNFDGDAIYGIYRFNIQKNDVKIISKQINFLNNKNEVMNKFNSVW